MPDKTGRYEFLAEPFHCDFTKRLSMGHLGNHLLNAADFHSTERGFGMEYLAPLHKTWVLSRLAIEMDEMPPQYARFCVETWVEGAMKYFTHRNFRITDAADGGRVYGYGRSIWAMIDTGTRQPQDILSIRDGEIAKYIDADRPCPIAGLSRVQIGGEAVPAGSIDTVYSDIDVNGHVNSVKYIEHALDLFSPDHYRQWRIRRFDVAYVAESRYGDRLNFYREDGGEGECRIRITKTPKAGGNDAEVCRCSIKFVKD